jgi:hypothetical protein
MASAQARPAKPTNDLNRFVVDLGIHHHQDTMSPLAAAAAFRPARRPETKAQAR